MSKTIFAKIKLVNFIFIFVLVISWVLLFINGLHQLDPDFGWHVTMGRLISENGIPKTDPFSYTMTSFPFVDHEWKTCHRIRKGVGFRDTVFRDKSSHGDVPAEIGVELMQTI